MQKITFVDEYLLLIYAHGPLVDCPPHRLNLTGKMPSNHQFQQFKQQATMKKTILAIAALAIFTVGNGFAQQGYPSKGHNVPAVSAARYDNAVEEYSINKLDNIVGLTRKQENQIKKIENNFDRLANTGRRPQTLQSLKRLEEQKQREIFSVLTPNQRQKLVAYQQADKYNSRGRYDNNGKFNRRG
jgi:Spy/CpxP family protein refolding chaperone